MKTTLTKILTLLVLVGCRDLYKKSEVQVWQPMSSLEIAKNEGLSSVESILYNPSEEVLYASNGKDYKPGSDGFISKISIDGKVEELKWVSGLNRPTGMALKDSLLYVADVNRLLAIHTKTREIIANYPEPIKNSGLNDVAIDANGDVYVSASFVHSVFKLEETGLGVWVQDESLLQWANGVHADQNEIVVGGLGLGTISLDSKQVKIIPLLSSIKDFDGIESDGEDGYFVTTVENSGLFHISSNGTVTELLEGGAYFGDLEYVADQGKLYIPRGNPETNTFYISEVTMVSLILGD